MHYFQPALIHSLILTPFQASLKTQFVIIVINTWTCIYTGFKTTQFSIFPLLQCAHLQTAVRKSRIIRHPAHTNFNALCAFRLKILNLTNWKWLEKIAINSSKDIQITSKHIYPLYAIQPDQYYVFFHIKWPDQENYHQTYSITEKYELETCRHDARKWYLQWHSSGLFHDWKTCQRQQLFAEKLVF